MSIQYAPFDQDLILDNLSGTRHTTLTLSLRVEAWGEKALRKLFRQLCELAEEGLIIKQSAQGAGFSPDRGEEYLFAVWVATSPVQTTWWGTLWRQVTRRLTSMIEPRRTCGAPK